MVHKTKKFKIPEETWSSVADEVEKMTKFLDVVLDDGYESSPKQFEDDNFIHISRGKYRYVFYNGQDKGAFTEKDVKRFADIVDRARMKVRMKRKK